MEISLLRNTANMFRFLNLWLLMAVAFAAGCGQAKQVAVPVPANSDPVIKTSATTESPKVKVEPTSTIALVATASEGTAEAAFQQTLIAFQDGRLDLAYDFLPPSYQTDVEALLKTFADKMDADLWSDAFSLLNKVANLLQTKKDLILKLDGVKRFPQIEQIKPHWDAIAAGIKDVATSDVADLSKLKSADVRQLLVSGSRLLSGLPLPKFGDVQVTTVKSDADTATLSYKDSQDPEPKQVEFVRVEGKWLPKSIATDWSGGIDDARARLVELSNRISGWKPEVTKQFETVNGMLDQIQSSKTSEEFQAAVMPLVFTVAFGAQLAQQAILDSEGNSRKGNAVNCIINRELTESELTSLRDVVLKSVGDSSSSPDYELIPNDGKTRCRFTPIADPESLVSLMKKHFSGATVLWNGDTKTILVDLK
jgi:hypothetical protein